MGERTESHRSESDLGGVRGKNKVLHVVLACGQVETFQETEVGSFSD